MNADIYILIHISFDFLSTTGTNFSFSSFHSGLPCAGWPFGWSAAQATDDDVAGLPSWGRASAVLECEAKPCLFFFFFWLEEAGYVKASIITV